MYDKLGILDRWSHKNNWANAKIKRKILDLSILNIKLKCRCQTKVGKIGS